MNSSGLFPFYRLNGFVDEESGVDSRLVGLGNVSTCDDVIPLTPAANDVTVLSSRKLIDGLRYCVKVKV